MENESNIKSDGTGQSTPETLIEYLVAPDAPEMTPDEAALRDIGEEQLEPPASFDIGGAGIPDYGDLIEEDHVPPAPEEKAPDIPDADDKAPEKKGRGGRQPKADKTPETEKPDKPKKAERAPRLAKAPKEDKGPAGAGGGMGGSGGSAQTTAANEETALPPAQPEQPPQPREAPRPNGTDQIIYLNLTELRPFKNHPFGIREDAEMKALVESVRVGGVNQPALVRPIEAGGYEIIAGHRRQKASELAGFFEMPCIVREMNDDEAVLAMTDDNLRQRSVILPSEKAASLKMQFEAIKHQGASGQNVPKDKDEIGQRSIEIVGQRNTVDGKPMNGKMVQRYIRLNELVPDLKKAIDEDRLGFTAAHEISYISRKNQNFIAVALESEQSKPSTEQAKRMRELDKKGLLNGDVIDGILCEEKKEELKVIISGKELENYFGKEKTPQQMKEQIIKLLDEWAGKEKAINPPEKKTPDRDK